MAIFRSVDGVTAAMGCGVKSTRPALQESAAMKEEQPQSIENTLIMNIKPLLQ